ncbi:MAG: DUF6111 family protein [Rhodospirillales bacterium]
MTRIFLTYVLPLVLPTAIYFAWIMHARRRHDAESGDDMPRLKKGSLFWSLLAGLLLMGAGLVTIALSTGEPPDSGTYVSPRLEDGKVVPPHFEKN